MVSTTNDQTLLARLSTARLTSYLTATGNDLTSALRLYEWNSAVAGTLFELLGHVEIVIRNALHDQLAIWHSERGFPGEWYDNAHGLLRPEALRDVENAKQRIVRAGKKVTATAVVAELNFGFWRFLLTKKYKTTLWPAVGSKAFPNLRGRDVVTFFERVHRLHDLRNRVAHHEPIHRRRLDRDLMDCLATIGAVCEDTERWAREHSRIEQVLRERPTIPET